MNRYIDADKAKAKLNYVCKTYGISPQTAKRIDAAITNTPTADVAEVKRGEWIPQWEGSRLLKCSVCGYEYCDLIECRNYCGNCGAKMDGERGGK